MPLKLEMDKNLKTMTSIPGWVESYKTGTGGNSVQAYKSSAWAFRAVNIRADAIASAPLKLYDGNDQEIDDHPVLDLLDTVNAEWNKGDLWRYTESAFCVYGAGYWRKVRAGSHIIEIQYMNPKDITVSQGSGGIQGFQQKNEKGGGFTAWPREDVVYFRGGYDPSTDLTGVAPLSMAIMAAMGEKNADKYMSAFFDNFAVPPLVLTTDQVMTDTLFEKTKQFWRKMFQGVDKQFKTGILGSGLKPVQLSSNVKDMALDTTRTEMHRTICVAVGVDELLLSASGAADKTPVDAALYHLYTCTIIPRWEYYQEVLDAELLPEYPDLTEKNAYFKFDQTKVKPLQDDQNEYAASLALLVEKGIIKAEVAATRLGFSKEDVPDAPEPAPAPIVIKSNPVVPANTTTPGLPVDMAVQDQATMDETSGARSIELDKWCRKSLSAIKAGKTASVEFISDVISEDDHFQITMDLDHCKTDKQVMEVFRIAKTGYKDNGQKALARALDRATNLLAATGDQ